MPLLLPSGRKWVLLGEIMETLTLAEALAELKRINSLLQKRYTNIRRYCSKRRGSKDEIESQSEYIKGQKQSALDLIDRYKRIKITMQRANLDASFEFNGKSYTIAEALLYKSYVENQFNILYASFIPTTALQQIQQYSRQLGSSITPEIAEKLDLVPELFYDETKIQQSKEELLTLMSYIDKLIDKTNHNTTIEF